MLLLGRCVFLIMWLFFSCSVLAVKYPVEKDRDKRFVLKIHTFKEWRVASYVKLFSTQLQIRLCF